MIRGFRDRRTAALFAGQAVRGVDRKVAVAVQRKLAALDQARSLPDLGARPGNRLHALKGDRAGQHAVRVNDRWRICFAWRDGGAERVEFTDYHD